LIKHGLCQKLEALEVAEKRIAEPAKTESNFFSELSGFLEKLGEAFAVRN